MQEETEFLINETSSRLMYQVNLFAKILSQKENWKKKFFSYFWKESLKRKNLCNELEEERIRLEHKERELQEERDKRTNIERKLAELESQCLLKQKRFFNLQNESLNSLDDEKMTIFHESVVPANASSKM